MLSKVIAGATRRLAKSQDEYNSLAVRDQPCNSYGNIMWSAWEPTPQELKILNAGGSVRLGIIGTAHPPVILDVEEAPALTEY